MNHRRISGSPEVGSDSSNKTARLLTGEKAAVEFVLLLWDADAHKIAIRPISKKDPRSYRVAYGEHGNGAGFSAKTFFDFIGLDYTESRPMSASWDSEQEMLIIDVPPAVLASKGQQKVHELERRTGSK